MNWKIILRVLSAISFGVGFTFLIPFFVSIFRDVEVNQSFGFGSIALVMLSFAGFVFTKGAVNKIGKREGYLIVSLSWLVVGLYGAIPYYAIESISLADSVFESFSGLTTTGASIFNDIEALPQSILLWRSLTQWIGGMGIIVFTVAIFPLLGVGGVELFVAESPGPTSSKIHPRISETAKRLWLIYIGMSLALLFILYFEGMSWFDSINHALTTISTGGFSTKNLSIAHFDSSLIEYTLVFFMFLAGTNFTLLYFGFKGKFDRIWRSEEFRFYALLVIVSALLAVFVVHTCSNQSLALSMRQGLFQVVSVITSTGFVTADYTAWHPIGTLFFFILFFTGASAGSTSGGVKIIRHLILAKNAFLEFKRLLHPNALIRIRLDNDIVNPRVITHILAFVLQYLFVFLVGTFAMTYLLQDFNQPFLSSIGAVATALANVGPGISELGPMHNFSTVPDSGKYILAIIMLIGRLEIFSVLILFTPYFWRNH